MKFLTVGEILASARVTGVARVLGSIFPVTRQPTSVGMGSGSGRHEKRKEKF
jgi:hypothetical protein